MASLGSHQLYSKEPHTSKQQTVLFTKWSFLSVCAAITFNLSALNGHTKYDIALFCTVKASSVPSCQQDPHCARLHQYGKIAFIRLFIRAIRRMSSIPPIGSTFFLPSQTCGILVRLVQLTMPGYVNN